MKLNIVPSVLQIPGGFSIISRSVVISFALIVLIVLGRSYLVAGLQLRSQIVINFVIESFAIRVANPSSIVFSV